MQDSKKNEKRKLQQQAYMIIHNFIVYIYYIFDCTTNYITIFTNYSGFLFSQLIRNIMIP